MDSELPLSGTERHYNLYGDVLIPFCHHRNCFSQIESQKMLIVGERRNLQKIYRARIVFNERCQLVSDIRSYLITRMPQRKFLW